MYVGMFLVGFGTAIAAIVRGFTATNMPEAITAVAFLGLTAASFFTLFLVRPLESLGRDGIFSSWLLGAMNTYWTRVMLISDPAKGDAELKDANAELMVNLSALADKYAAAIGKYPPLEDAGGKRPSR
jgi:predicted MFS family arabinose efflux permease